MFRDIIGYYFGSFMFPIMLIIGLYIQIHGDYSPGGGFQAGAIIATALVMYSLINKNCSSIRVILSLNRLRVYSAMGIIIYGGVGVICMIKGGNFLEYSVLLEDDASGQQLGIMLIELAVGITVCSVMLLIYFGLLNFGEK